MIHTENFEWAVVYRGEAEILCGIFPDKMYAQVYTNSMNEVNTNHYHVISIRTYRMTIEEQDRYDENIEPQ